MAKGLSGAESKGSASGSLAGRVAIVTGASTGIGAAIARAFGHQGVSVAVSYLSDEPGARAVCNNIRDTGSSAIAVRADVASEADCHALTAAALDTFGRIDILVNNAAARAPARGGSLSGLDAGDFRALYDANLIGAFQMAKHCAEALKASGRGAIVNVSSVAGVSGAGSSIAYAASKGALNTLTLSLARSLAPEVRVNAVCPGLVWVERLQRSADDAALQRIREAELARTPLTRVAEPDDIADVVLFFCSDASRHVTGELLAVDGGRKLT